MPSAVADLAAEEVNHFTTSSVSSPRLFGPESAALFIIGIPIAWLTWRSAGVDSHDQALAFAWILGATAIIVALARDIALPWPAVFISLIPILQLLPLEIAQGARLDSLYQQIAANGISPPTQISIYPYATLGRSFVLAGYCALFTVSRTVSGRSIRAALLIIGSLLAIALVQSVLGFQQHLASQSLEDPAAPFAHGSFVNRDHFAALLEGCYGLALGLTLAMLAERNWKRWIEGRESAITVATLLVGASCAAAIVFSYSRMGIIVLAAMTVALLLLTLIRNRMAAVLLGVAGAAAAFAVSAAGLRGLYARFAELIAQHGDPGRLAIWRDTLRIVPDFLWAGCGLGAFPFVFHRSEPYLPLKGIDHAHSDYLELLLELGLPAALLLFGSIAYVFLHTLWKLPATPDSKLRWTALGCLLGAGGIFFHAAVDFPLQIPAVGAVAAVLFLQGRWGHLDAESLSGQAHAAGMQGALDDADRIYLQALAANPLAAATWIARAELADTRGNAGDALRMLQLAEALEPFTVRTEWALANLHMRQGEHRSAAQHFGTLAASIPQMRASIVAAASAGGISPTDIAARIVPPDGEAAGEFLIHLVREQAWPDLIAGFDALPAGSKQTIPAHLLRYVFDRAFAANRGATYLQLWERIHSTSIETLPTNQSLLTQAADQIQPFGSQGYGLRWITRQHQGVTTRLHIGDRDVPTIEIRFIEPQNIHYTHLRRDFAVRTGRRYTLEAEVQTDGITSSEGIRLLISSSSGPVVESKPIRRTTPWTKIRLRFRASPTDHVLRLLVVRYPSNHLDKNVVGTISLRNVRLSPIV